MKLKHNKNNSGFTLVELLVVIAIIAALAAISSPIILRQQKKGRLTQASNNARDIYHGIKDFADDTTGSAPALSTDTNTSLKVLFEGGYLRDEGPFHIAGAGSLNLGAAPDGDISTGATGALAAGECAWSLFTVTTAITANGHASPVGGIPIIDIANAPLLATPVSAVGTLAAATFNTNSMAGKAVVLTADGSTKQVQILPTGLILGSTYESSVNDATGATQSGSYTAATIL